MAIGNGCIDISDLPNTIVEDIEETVVDVVDESRMISSSLGQLASNDSDPQQKDSAVYNCEILDNVEEKEETKVEAVQTTLSPTSLDSVRTNRTNAMHAARELVYEEGISRERLTPIYRNARHCHTYRRMVYLLMILSLFFTMILVYPKCSNEENSEAAHCWKVMFGSIFSLLSFLFFVQIALCGLESIQRRRLEED
ncbi:MULTISPECIES: hypothetical protein [Candidatus Ichthyocystis]|nr:MULTISPECIES: hypothetical protein [Ichthyocystis]